MRLVLASQSQGRLTTLRNAGVEPEVVVSGVDESTVDAAGAEELSVRLAVMKAHAVVDRLDGPALVVGCDSVLELDGEVYGKPGTVEAATARWRAMRGRSGVLHTGHCLVDTAQGREVVRPAATVVRFAALDDDEIDAYVATGEPLHVAGAFTLSLLGGAYVTAVEGDPHNVVGISLPMLREMLRELGHRWHDLWHAPSAAAPAGPGTAD